MVRGLRRAGRVAAVMLPFALAACQSFIKSPAPCGDGTTAGDGCPHTLCDPKVLTNPTVYAAACDLDHLEKHIDWHGSVVAKVPDVWGQARLTLYREQFEAEMVKDLGTFELNLQGSVARQDQAFLLSATSLTAALETPVRPYRRQILPAGRYLRSPTADPLNKDNIIVLDKDQTVLIPPAAPPNSLPASPPLPGVVRNPGDGTTTASDVSFFFGSPGFNLNAFQGRFLSPDGQALKIGLEPERYLEQKKRYLDLLAQIRRTNEGDDTADAPGYQLQLMRIPVSVLPGKHTDRAHGAEITMTLTPVLGDSLLPTTFRSLVVNDLVSQLGFPITQSLNPGASDAFKDLITPEVKAILETITQVNDYLDGTANGLCMAQAVVKNLSKEEYAIVKAALDEDDQKFLEKLVSGGGAVTEKLSRQAATGNLKLGAVRDVVRAVEKGVAMPKRGVQKDNEPLSAEVTTFRGGLSTSLSLPPLSFATGTESRTGLPTSQLVDVYGTAYSFTIALGARQAFQETIRRQRYAHLPDVQAYLKEELNAAYDMLSDPHNHELWNFCSPTLVRLVRTQAFDELDKHRREFRKMVAKLALSKPTNTDRPEPAQLSRSAAFAWGIVVDAALLNDKLCKDMRAASDARGSCIPGLGEWMPLYLPCPTPDLCQTFNQYVRVRWPIHVFALDPAIQEQNLADRLTTRRELQLALSLAFAHGFMNFNQLTRYARRLEAEYETIDLNRTQVGFAHGSDTFGWRFYPRFQTPDTPGNLTVIARDLIAGGPNRSQLLRERRLEPGPRECVALVIMPSFVPAVQLSTTSNFFGLANPKHKVFDHTQAVKLGRTVQAIKNAGCGLTDANCYRDGDAARLVKRAEQLEARLPMQTVTFQVPTEGTLGGFELFNTSTTSLSPELYGFYGAPGADSQKVTTLFLVGDHFSPLRTRVLVGNKGVSKDSSGPKLTMLSRQVLQVDFGPELIPLNASHVTVHVATPYGVSRELLVPLVNTTASQPDGYYVTSESKLTVNYATTAVANTNPQRIKAAASSVGPDPVVVSAQFANGVVPAKVRVEIVGVPSDPPIDIAADPKSPGRYVLAGANYEKAVKAWFAKYVEPDATFASAAEVEGRLPPGLLLKVIPFAGDQLGTQQPVNGVLRAVAVKQSAPATATVTAPAFRLESGAKFTIDCTLEAAGDKFKVKSFGVSDVSLNIGPVPAAGAPAAVKVSIVGGTDATANASLNKDGKYTIGADVLAPVVSAWARKFVKDGDTYASGNEVIMVLRMPMKFQLVDAAGGAVKNVDGDVTVTVKAPEPKKQ